MARTATGPKTYLRSARWWAWWADGAGGKISRSLRDTHGNDLRKGAAQSDVYLAAAREFELWRSVPEGAGDLRQPTGTFTVGMLMDQYVQSQKSTWTTKTVQAYKVPILRFKKYFGTARLATSITPNCVEGYKVWLTREKSPAGNPLSGRTVNNNIRFASSVMEYAFAMEIISRNPFNRVKLLQAKPVRENDPFTPKEVACILTTAKEHYPQFYPVVLLVSITGQRPGAIPFMRVKHYDAKNQTLLVNDEISKRQKGNLYALTGEAAAVFDRHTQGRSPEELLFLSKDNKPLSEKTFDTPDRSSKTIPPSRTWYHLLDKAGVRPRGISNLRKGLVTNMAKDGAHMDHIVMVTGHSKDVARDHYLKKDLGTQRDTIARALSLYLPQSAQSVKQVAIEPSIGLAAKPSAVPAEMTPIESRPGAGISVAANGIQISPKDADRMLKWYWLAQMKMTHSGTNSGTIGNAPIADGCECRGYGELAERQGFEPWVPFRAHTLSKRAP